MEPVNSLLTRDPARLDLFPSSIVGAASDEGVFFADYLEPDVSSSRGSSVSQLALLHSEREQWVQRDSNSDLNEVPSEDSFWAHQDPNVAPHKRSDNSRDTNGNEETGQQVKEDLAKEDLADEPAVSDHKQSDETSQTASSKEGETSELASAEEENESKPAQNNNAIQLSQLFPNPPTLPEQAAPAAIAALAARTNGAQGNAQSNGPDSAAPVVATGGAAKGRAAEVGTGPVNPQALANLANGPKKPTGEASASRSTNPNGSTSTLTAAQTAALRSNGLGTASAAPVSKPAATAQVTPQPSPVTAPTGAQPSEAQLQATLRSQAQGTLQQAPVKSTEAITVLQDTQQQPAASNNKANGAGNPLLAQAKASGEGGASTQSGNQNAGQQSNSQQQNLSQSLLTANNRGSEVAQPNRPASGPQFAQLVSASQAATTSSDVINNPQVGASNVANQARGIVQAAVQSGTIQQSAPGQQIALQVSRGAKAGLDRISMQLHPAEMGRIDIKMEFNEAGQLRAVVSAERPETLDLLQRDQRGLERALQEAGVKTDSQSLSFNRGQDQQANQGEKGSGQASPRHSAGDDDVAEDQNSNKTRQSNHNGALDIEV